MLLSRNFTCTALFAFSLLILAISGCGDSSREVDEELHTIRFATATPLQSFDPHLSDTGPTFTTYLTLVYDGLTSINPDDPLVPLPGLAREWTWLNDTTIEFKLVDNAVFSDGTLFDAEVAKANIERMLRLQGPRFNTMASIRAIELIDALTLRIHLHQRDPTLLQNLALSPGLMVSTAAFDKPDLDLNPVGTGPWRYDQVNSVIGEKHHFTPNPGYFDSAIRSEVNLEVQILRGNRTRLNALIGGQTDLTPVTALEATQALAAGFSIAKRANRWFGFSILDRSGELVPELADRRVRQALGFAVDRESLADALFFGYARPASQPMRAGLGHVTELENFYRYDPDHARQLLKSAGIQGFTFTAPITQGASSRYEAIQHYLREVGIDMKLEIVEPGSVAALARSKRYPVNTIAFPSFDPDSRHPAIWETTAVWNPFRNEGARINALANEAMTSADQGLRELNYRKYFEIIVKDVHSMVYLQIDDLLVYDSSKITGVRVSTYIDPHLRHVRLVQNRAGSVDKH